MNQGKKIISVILACIAVLCLIGAGLFTIRQLNDNRRSEQILDDLRASAESLKEQQSASPSATAPVSTVAPVIMATDAPPAASATVPSASPAPTEAPTPEPTASPEPTAEPKVNPYRDSFLANEDMAAWLQIPGTVIDYPVMWTPRDENYYLYRDFDGKQNQNGCLILDTDSSLEPLTTNLIIHGHNMKSGAMFGDLTDYENYSYYEKHKEIILYTEGIQRNYEVIAVFRSQVYRKSDDVFKFYKFFQADTQEEFDDFYSNIKSLSQYDTGVTAEFGDHFITLSTCVYHVENGRFVVVAKEVAPGDSYLPISQ